MVTAQNTHGSSTLDIGGPLHRSSSPLPEWFVEAQLRCQGKIQGVEGCRQADLNVLAACPGGPLEHGKNHEKTWENIGTYQTNMGKTWENYGKTWKNIENHCHLGRILALIIPYEWRKLEP